MALPGIETGRIVDPFIQLEIYHKRIVNVVNAPYECNVGVRDLDIPSPLRLAALRLRGHFTDGLELVGACDGTPHLGIDGADNRHRIHKHGLRGW